MENYVFEPVHALAAMALAVLFFILWMVSTVRSRKALRRFDKVIDAEKEAVKIVNAARSEKEQLSSAIASDAARLDELRSDYTSKRAVYEELADEVAMFDEKLAFAELGIYEPHFDFNDSNEFKRQIKFVRDAQKDLISKKEATEVPAGMTLDGSLSKGKTLIDRQTRLTMRAFNNECEAAIANTRWNNVNAMQKRIQNSAKQIDGANASMGINISSNYIELKLAELRLTHEHREMQKVEKDEKAELARTEREEKKLLKEAEKAEKEELQYSRLLEQARKEASVDESKIAELEAALSEAQAAGDRARSMAEMTKSGYVYVISNIGAFGEDVVKIGLTRRLNPDDRVKELGDASVPFSFDTHAMIYSDEAPTLETALHNEFADRRINTSNLRKEFFRVKLEEVEEAVARLMPAADFFSDREAQEWHETLARRNAMLTNIQNQSDTFPSSI